MAFSISRPGAILMLIALLAFSAVGGTASAREITAAPENWSKAWEIDLAKEIGFQRYPVDLYKGEDGNLYFTNRPGKGAAKKIVAVSADGKIKWKTELPTEHYLSYPFDHIDRNGNVYIRFDTDDEKLVVHKIGPDGKLKAKFTLPGRYKRETIYMKPEELAKLARYAIAYPNDNTIRIARSDGSTGMLEFYAMNAQGKIYWQKRLKAGGSVDIKGPYAIVSTSSYSDVYDLKGNKLFRLPKQSGETLEVAGVEKDVLIGSRFVLNQQGFTSVRLFGIGPDGKTKWIKKQENNSLLYRWAGAYVLKTPTSLKRLDPANGNLNVLLSGKEVFISNEDLFDLNGNLTLALMLEDQSRSSYLLLDPAAEKPVPVNADNRGLLLPNEKKNGIWFTAKGKAFQRDNRLELVLWHQAKIVSYAMEL